MIPYRVLASNVLKSYISNNNQSELMEETLYNYCFKTYSNKPELSLDERFSNYYYFVIYQVIGFIIQGVTTHDIIDLVQKNQIGWEHALFEKHKCMKMEQDDFIIQPFEVAEGVIQCKCGCSRVWSYSKQCRSADEPMTTFATCVECNRKWTHSD